MMERYDAIEFDAQQALIEIKSRMLKAIDLRDYP